MLMVLLWGVFQCASASSSFEKAVADVYASKPHLKPCLHEEKKEILTEKQIKTALNVAAFSYASIKIYYAHARMAGADHQQGWFSWLCPSSMQRITRKGQFFIESLGICCEALAYKSLAKLLYMAFKGDLFDLIANKA